MTVICTKPAECHGCAAGGTPGFGRIWMERADSGWFVCWESDSRTTNPTTTFRIPAWHCVLCGNSLYVQLIPDWDGVIRDKQMPIWKAELREAWKHVRRAIKEATHGA